MLDIPTLVVYQKNKYGIIGPLFKLPFMGPFLQSLNPKFEEYAAKWASGPLSCVSVFHKFVFCEYLFLLMHHNTDWLFLGSSSLPPPAI